MAFSQSDLDHLIAILARAGRDEVMPRFKALHAGDVRQKTSLFDPVTAADEAAERAITAALRAAWPDGLVVGEEAAAADPALPALLGAAPLAFTVDPIDGTRNYIAGLPLFGVMAAVIARGMVVAGAIHDPVIGDTVHALAGQGAWLSRQGAPPRRLRVAEPGALGRMEAFANTRFLPEPLRATVSNNLSKMGAVASLRCAAHEYRTAASGACHVLMYCKLLPWDHAAGSLIHREAGGYSARFDGSPYLPAHTSGGLICAPDRASWTLVRDGLMGALAP